MGTAYTPGLTVSADHVVKKTRRLPLKGEVLVTEGQIVEPQTVIARTELPGILQSIKVSEKLGVEAKEVKDLLKVSIGDSVEVGQLLAESKGLFGLFKGQVLSEFEGKVEDVSDVTGNVLVREPPVPIEIAAYLRGRVAEIIPEEGAIVEARGAVVQGIFGVGGERVGALRTAVESPDDVLDAGAIREDDVGKVLVGGSQVTLDAIRKAEKVGVLGLVAGAVRDLDLTEYLSYDIGVAITGNEPITLTIIATEGFGRLRMADRTFELLRSLEEKEASVNGATQIRAGVIRPEIIVPSDVPPTEAAAAAEGGGTLEAGTPVRIIREPWFGKLATVSALPPELQGVESGAEVRVLRAVLDETGEEVTVPRANVEIIAK